MPRRTTPKPVHTVALDAMQHRVALLADERRRASALVERMKGDARYNKASLKAARVTKRGLAAALKAARAELRACRQAWADLT